MASDPRYAPEGKVWFCRACGKTTKDLYGGATASYGWDASCVMNAVLVAENTVTRYMKGAQDDEKHD